MYTECYICKPATKNKKWKNIKRVCIHIYYVYIYIYISCCMYRIVRAIADKRPYNVPGTIEVCASVYM